MLELGASKPHVLVNLAVTLAEAHSVKRLWVFLHFDSPIDHGCSLVKETVWRVGKNRNTLNLDEKWLHKPIPQWLQRAIPDTFNQVPLFVSHTLTSDIMLVTVAPQFWTNI